MAEAADRALLRDFRFITVNCTCRQSARYCRISVRGAATDCSMVPLRASCLASDAAVLLFPQSSQNLGGRLKKQTLPSLSFSVFPPQFPCLNCREIEGFVSRSRRHYHGKMDVYSEPALGWVRGLKWSCLPPPVHRPHIVGSLALYIGAVETAEHSQPYPLEACRAPVLRTIRKTLKF